MLFIAKRCDVTGEFYKIHFASLLLKVHNSYIVLYKNNENYSTNQIIKITHF